MHLLYLHNNYAEKKQGKQAKVVCGSKCDGLASLRKQQDGRQEVDVCPVSRVIFNLLSTGLHRSFQPELSCCPSLPTLNCFLLDCS